MTERSTEAREWRGRDGHRTMITPLMVAAIELGLQRGHRRDVLALGFGVTEYVIGVIAGDREPPEHAGTLPGRDTVSGGPFHRLYRMEDEVALEQPERCPECGALIAVIPCRACHPRRLPNNPRRNDRQARDRWIYWQRRRGLEWAVIGNLLPHYGWRAITGSGAASAAERHARRAGLPWPPLSATSRKLG